MTGCRPFTLEEILALLTHWKEKGGFHLREAAWLAVCSFTGLRITSVLTLTVGEVQCNGLVNEELYIQRRNVKGQTSGIRLPLHPIARMHLQAWLTWLTSKRDLALDSAVFQGRKGRAAITRQHAELGLLQACSALGVAGKVGTHSCRKHFVKALYAALDGDLIKLMNATGHKSINSLIYYLNSIDPEDEIHDAILALADCQGQEERRLRVA